MALCCLGTLICMVTQQKMLGYFLIFINIAMQELVESHLGGNFMIVYIYIFMYINWAKIVLYLTG